MQATNSGLFVSLSSLSALALQLSGVIRNEFALYDMNMLLGRKIWKNRKISKRGYCVIKRKIFGVEIIRNVGWAKQRKLFSDLGKDLGKEMMKACHQLAVFFVFQKGESREVTITQDKFFADGVSQGMELVKVWS